MDLHRQQGIVQGTYETFVEAGRQHYDGDLKGKWILTGGLGGMGGAQPLAAVMAGACCLAVECNPDSIDFRLRTKYVDERADTLDEALAMIEQWTAAGEAKSVGLLGNAADVFPELLSAAFARYRDRPDQRPRSDSMAICRRAGAWQNGTTRRESDPKAVEKAARASMKIMWRRWLISGTQGCQRWITATTSARWRWKKGWRTPLPFPVCARLYPSAVLPWHRPVPLGGAVRRSRGYLQDRSEGEGTLPENTHLHNWLDMARERIAFQGLPARICWVGLGDRHKAGLAFNEMVASGELSAPVVIGRDHLDSGSVASPNRETEAMKDGSDAVSDWPLLNALVNTASGGNLGQHSPRRRCRHGVFAARRGW